MIATNPTPRAATADSSILRSFVCDLGATWRKMPPAHIIAFDAAAFTGSDFARHGVSFPPALARAVPKRRTEFLAGRLAARAALASIGVTDRNIGIGSFRQPIWPEGTVGSISHSGTLAAAVAAPASAAAGIGIDVEDVAPEHAGAIETAGVLDPDEIALGAVQRNPIDRSTALTIMFSAKESFFKGVFHVVNRYFGFDAVRVVAIDLGQGRLTLELATGLADALAAGQRFEIGCTHVQPETVLTAFIW